MDNLGSIFTSRLEKLLKESNMTQKELAEKIDTPARTLNHWIRGNSFPRLDKVVEIAEVLDVDLNYLIGKTPGKQMEISFNEKETTTDLDKDNVLGKLNHALKYSEEFDKATLLWVISLVENMSYASSSYIRIPYWFEKWMEQFFRDDRSKLLMINKILNNRLIAANGESILNKKRNSYLQKHKLDFILAVITGKFESFNDNLYAVKLLDNNESYLLYSPSLNKYKVGRIVKNEDSDYTHKLSETVIKRCNPRFWAKEFLYIVE